jgi:hypothetical protein
LNAVTKKTLKNSGTSRRSKWNDSLDHLDPEWEEGRTYQLVCGLTVPRNLRVVSSADNARKSNRFIPWRVPSGWPPPEEPGDWAWFLHPNTHEWVFTQWLGSLWWKLAKPTCAHGQPKPIPKGCSNFVAYHERRKTDPRFEKAWREQHAEASKKGAAASASSCLGKKRATNGTLNVWLAPDEPLPEGFWFGQTQKRRSTAGEKNSCFGKKCVTNGKENRFQDPTQPLPEGFWFGQTRRASPSS